MYIHTLFVYFIPDEPSRDMPELTRKPHPDAKLALTGVCTCAVLRKVTRQMTKVYEDAMAACPLTLSQFGIVAHVIRSDGPSLQTLSDALRMDQSTLSRSIKSLEKLAFLELSPSQTDARIKEVRVTPAGINAFELTAPEWKIAQSTIAEKLSAGGQAQLRETLMGVLSMLDE